MRVVLAIYVAFLSVALIGCTGTGITTPLPAPTPTPTQSPSPTPAPTASPTPSPTPAPTPGPIIGSFLYDVGITPGGLSGLSTFQIDPQTHLISALTGSTFNAAFPVNVDPVALIGLAADKTGRFLLTAFNTNPAVGPIVQSYRRNSDGSFTNVTNMTLPVSGLVAATMDPQNRFFYIAALERVPVVYVLSLDPISGALTLTSTVTLSVAPAPQDVSSPSAITTNSSGNFLYVTISPGPGPSPVIVGLAVQADGSLTPTGNIEIAPGVNDPNAVFANDSNVYVGDKHVGVFAFSINSTSGALTPVAGSPFITNSANVLAFAQLGNFLYVGTNSLQSISGVLDPATVFAFQIQSGGGLVPVTGSPFQPAFNAQCLTIQGSFLYVGDQSNIQGFAIDALTGKLTSVFSQPTAVSNRGCVALP
jgi:hypothetical protein